MTITNILNFQVNLVSIKQTGWAELFHLLHEKKVQGGAKIFLLHEK